ncbi:hypothetical protein AWC18_01570 [Mycolicibacter nonchromogenicus]|uniref:Uncharacterized protein n=1 Tax=Mycolicibacter nonchromogenicus TaxID=1782 RepID=A0A1X1ZR33_MYCNO|nr:hypothetical protein AWC18_01570 [Mycolicibacter nonchromogenicus]
MSRGGDYGLFSPFGRMMFWLVVCSLDPMGTQPIRRQPATRDHVVDTRAVTTIACLHAPVGPGAATGVIGKILYQQLDEPTVATDPDPVAAGDRP